MRPEMHTIRSADEMNHMRAVIERLQRDGMNAHDIESVVREMTSDTSAPAPPIWARLRVPLARLARR